MHLSISRFQYRCSRSGKVSEGSMNMISVQIMEDFFLRKLTENVSLIKSFPKATQETQETRGRTRSNQLVGRDATATPTWIRPFIISNDVTLKRDVHDHLLKPSQTCWVFMSLRTKRFFHTLPFLFTTRKTRCFFPARYISRLGRIPEKKYVIIKKALKPTSVRLLV